MLVRKKTPRIYTPAKDVRDLTHIFKAHGAKVAFRYYRGKQLLSMSYREFSDLIVDLAAGFDAMGLAGKRVAIIGESCPQWIATYLAIIAAGGVAIPMDKEVAVPELEGFMSFAEADAVVYTACMNEKFKDTVETHPTVQYFIPVSTEKLSYLHHPKIKEFDDVVALGQKNIHDNHYSLKTPKDLRRMAVMLFTSGTTGYPRIATHSYKYALGHYPTARHWHNVQPGGLHFTISDTGWGKALWGKLYGQWLCEAATFTYDFDRFRSEDILPMFAKYGITTFCAPPTMYRFFIKEDLSKYDLSSIRYATTAGEALNPEVSVQFKKATGLTIMEGFGQTETTLSIANFVGTTPKIGSMGRPSPLYDVVLLDPDGNPCPTGDTGEICIRVKDTVPCGLFIGYYLDEERTRDVWHDGYYHTGDQATMDEDGYLWFVGRIDDVIKSSGYRIGPFEIESVIMELPYVLECGVSAEPDEIRGQVVKASVVLTKGTEPSDALKKEIQEYVKTHTAPYKYPRIVVFKDELPKTISGKIIRNKL